MADFFQGVLNSAIYVPRGRFGGKNFFSKKPRQFSFGNRAVNFVVFLQKFSRNDIQKCLVPFKTNTCNQAIISGETFFFVVLFGFWGGKYRQGCQKTVYVDRRKMEESGFYFERFDSWYCFLTLNKTFRISVEKFQQGCQYCNLRVEMNNLRRNIFFLSKLSVSIYLRIFRTTSLDVQRKKNQDFQNCS